MATKALLKYSEWEIAGQWYCNDISDLTSIRSKWWAPARMLNISPADYVKLIIDKFKPDSIHYFPENDVLIYSWKSIAAMRLFKNWLNKQARERKFIV